MLLANALWEDYRHVTNIQLSEDPLRIMSRRETQRSQYLWGVKQDLEVFLYSIGYFFPMPTTEKYYEPEEGKLCLVINWFIQNRKRLLKECF